MRAEIDQFCDHLEHERRSSGHTVRAYRGDLLALADHIEAATNRAPQLSDLNLRWVRDMLADAHAGLDQASLARRLSALRRFSKYCVERGWRDEDELALIDRPKTRHRLPTALPVEDIQALLEGPYRPGPVGCRDRALMELLYATGLRVSEVVALEIEHLQWEGAQLTIRVVEGKGGKDRLVPAGTKAVTALREYLAVRESMVRNNKPCEALFLGVRGGRLSVRSLRDLVYRRCQSTGVRAVVGPHGVRHSFATHLLESGCDLRSIQSLLGHASLSTTQRYTHLDMQRLTEVYETSHPRAAVPSVDSVRDRADQTGRISDPARPHRGGGVQALLRQTPKAR